ncbi:hypothetical protein K458DRAFT_293459 [Lentithecium fluviatile CBS 122367]|uniref:XRCC4 coiled-coil domain-containing protein n=1 Tax=Lentithecium fluviatile CBS 122367 TaxID=1168545 RepID=A0A6G1JDT5_9PLEO|nr:hypothetical protein K458DRAFT_293459 [Lentithecium fluviatile CBS 122367]
MDGRYIVPVEPATGAGEVVVIEVRQNGSRPLDVQLVGCEGESPYVVSLQQRNIGKLKHKFKSSDKEWEEILCHFLRQEHPEGGHARILDNVRMVYTLKKDNLEVSFRQDIKGIKVTLGEIILPKDEEFEFNPFEWARRSAKAHTRTLQELADLKARATGEQETIAKLQAQLDDFIKTKNETEKEMLQQFMALLNEKKRKIRDQGRLLAGAKVNESTASAVKASREETKPRKAAASRTSKRKATAKAAEPEPEPEQLSDADQMEIDQAKNEEPDEDSGPGAATPDRPSDDETEDEDGPSGITPASSAAQVRGKSSKPTRSQSSEDVPVQDDEVPPPRRELPFGRPTTRGRPTQKQPAAPMEDDETEDEEL